MTHPLPRVLWLPTLLILASAALLLGTLGCADGKSSKTRPCGNGALDPGEQCDDHNTLPDDGCDAACALEDGWTCEGTPTVCAPVCGDGLVVGLEPCDDGARTPGDGCDADCGVEHGWTCEAMPSVCQTTCGDGLVAAGVEACDDGALSTGDGCNADCDVEDGWTCDGASPSVCGAAACGDDLGAGDEACDGWDLRGATCASLGFDGGDLRCDDACIFDTLACQRCGDGRCDDGETCAQDCGATGLSVGFAHTCALMVTGRAWCWGYNQMGQLGNGRVGAETGFWGILCDSTPQEVLGVDELVLIHAGFTTTCGITDGGALKCWGSNQYGQLGDGLASHGISCEGIDCSLIPVDVDLLAVPTAALSVASGWYHSCLIGAMGEVACWGSNEHGALGDGLASHGTTCEGVDCSRRPVAVSGLTQNVLALAASNQFTCALRLDGTVWCWGGNDSGQLGNGTTTASGVPVQVFGLTDVTAISAGDGYACALRGDRSVWCWGKNSVGQLGDGTTTDRATPVRVGTLSADGISCGGDHVCVRKADDSTWCWGGNASGQLGTGGTDPSPVPVQVPIPSEPGHTGAGGWYYSCALSTLTGAVSCWGNNALGQLGQGNLDQSLTPVTVPGLHP